MTYQTASKYNRMFKLLSSAYTILIISYLLENENAQTIEVIAKETRTSNPRIFRTCEKLYKLGIVNRNTQGVDSSYEVIDSNENTKVIRNIFKALN